jgi:hypothetical protein
MRPLKIGLFFMLFLLFSAKMAAQEANPALHLLPEHYDSLCIRQLCEPTNVPQYYRLGVKNLKSSYQILKAWKAFYSPDSGFSKSGFLTIRFLVNCKGDACCFRFSELDEKYQPTEYPKELKEKMAAFVEQLGSWKFGKLDDTPSNYFYYFTFKIQNGEFKTVAP